MNSIKTTNALLLILVLGFFGAPIAVFLGFLLVAAISGGLSVTALSLYLWPAFLSVGGVLLVASYMSPRPAWAAKPGVLPAGWILASLGLLAFLTWIISQRL